jgi:polyisoprenoid-binding protein YceI
MTLGTSNSGRWFKLNCSAALVMLLMAAVTGAQSRAWTVATGDVRVTCPMTVGGSFEAKSSALAGKLSVDPSSTVLAGELSVDLKTLDTGISLRNQHMVETYLEAGKGEGFDNATLSNIDAGSLASGVDGQKPFTARLRLHGVTQAVAGRATLSTRGSSVRVDASFPVRISSYGIAAPRYLGVGVKDDVTVRVVFNATTTP